VEAVPAATDPGEIALAAGIATRAPDGAVHFAPPPDRPGETPPAPTPAATAAQPPDLGAMADALYERLERRLRTDLFLERERRGATVDM
jgi:hypothetical protein